MVGHVDPVSEDDAEDHLDAPSPPTSDVARRLDGLLGAQLLDAVRSLARTMRARADDADVLTEAVRALAWCVRERLRPAERLAVLRPADEGVHVALCGAMRRHRGVTGLQLHACDLLAALSEDEEGDRPEAVRDVLVAAGCRAQDELVAAMRAHPGEAELQRHACTALGNLATADGVPAECLLDAIRAHAGDADVAAAACWALLCRGDALPEPTTAAGAAAAELVRAARERHARHAVLRSNATLLLYQLDPADADADACAG